MFAKLSLNDKRNTFTFLLLPQVFIFIESYIGFI